MLFAFVGGFPSTERHVSSESSCGPSLDSGAISSLDLASATGSASSITALMSLSLFVLSSGSSTASSLFHMSVSISPLSFALFTVPRSFGNSNCSSSLSILFTGPAYAYPRHSRSARRVSYINQFFIFEALASLNI